MHARIVASLRWSSLGARPLHSQLRGSFHRLLHVPLPRIFGLNTRKGFASNPEFFLLTLTLPSVRTKYFVVAHMFTSRYHVADVVPTARRKGEHCQVPRGLCWSCGYPPQRRGMSTRSR